MQKEKRAFYESRFYLEDMVEDVRGYTAGERWNGWATPYFPFEESERVVAQINRFHKEPGLNSNAAYYDSDADEFCFPAENEWDRYGPSDIDVAGELMKVYAIGACYWVWSEEKD